jgi:hypothetical protein
MLRVHGMKVICLTTGDLMNVLKQSSKHGVMFVMRSQRSTELTPKSDAIVQNVDNVLEGLNLKK